MGYYITVMWDIEGEKGPVRDELEKKIRKDVSLGPRKWDYGKNWDPFPIFERYSREYPDYYIYIYDYVDRGKVHETIYYDGVGLNAKVFDLRRPLLSEVKQSAERVRKKKEAEKEAAS